MSEYINVRWVGERPEEEKSLENLKQSFKNIEKDVERRKQELFENVCYSTKLFRFGDPKEIFKQDLLHEAWLELHYGKKQYYVNKESLEEFKRNVIGRILEKFGNRTNRIIIDIPLLSLPEDHSEWQRARMTRSISDIIIVSDNL